MFVRGAKNVRGGLRRPIAAAIAISQVIERLSLEGKMKRNHYLGMRPGDLDGKPCGRYWQPELEPGQPHVAQAVLHGGEAAGLALPIADVDGLVTPEYVSLGNGFARLAGGTIFVAVRDVIPRLTGAMFEWWMGWNCMENQRAYRESKRGFGVMSEWGWDDRSRRVPVGGALGSTLLGRFRFGLKRTLERSFLEVRLFAEPIDLGCRNSRAGLAI